MPDMNVAVIGCGYWGQNLIRTFWTLGDAAALDMVCDTNVKALAGVRKLYPTVLVARSFDEVLNNPAINAVAIATPVSTHYSLAKAALMAGKHVLVEKPLASNSAEVAELIEIAEKMDLSLMVDHTFLYTGAVRKMKELIVSGQIGDLLYYDSVRINLGLVQSDTNVLWDLGPHDLSIMDHLNEGGVPLSISATGVRHFQTPHENIAYVTVKYENNFIAHFHLNWLAPVKIRTTLLGGSKKMLVYDDMEPTEKVKVYDRGVTVNPDPAGRAKMLTGYRKGDVLVPMVESAEALRAMALEFAASISEKRPAMTDGWAGYRIVQLLEAAQRSMEQNGREIELTGEVLVRRHSGPKVVAKAV